MKANHCHVFHDTADADLLIVKKAIVSAQTMETVIVGDDTDLLLLLIYHDPLDKNNLLFAPEPKKNSNSHIWDIKHVKNELGSLSCKHILFQHSQAAVTFDNPNSTPAQVESAGEKVLVAIYNGKSTDTLNTLRHKKYSEKVVVNTTHVDPKNIPPTFAAAKFYSYRVFLQINQ